MATLWAIWRREVQAYFASPIAYVVLAFFIFLYGYFFYDYLYLFIERGMGRGGFGGPEVMNLNEDLIRWLFHTTCILVLFLLPLVTMRSFSEEIRSGTIELLLTSPVTDGTLVLGKFLGAATLYASMLGLTLVHIGILFFFGDPEWRPLVAGYLGMLLLGCSFISVGLVFSSLTRNQVIAGFLSFGTFLFLWLIEYAESWAGSLSGLVTYLSVTKHIEEFAKGVLDTRDVVYYLSFIALGLFLTRQSIESLRWRG
ncbi:MAG TPA: ABC transporter permease [Vicinamibacteria bacterium]|nr:ABC transporter permease [Vicinamibacteria bacterium]